MQRPWQLRSVRNPFRVFLFLLVGGALAACDGTTEPGDNPLRDLDEMAIYAAIEQRLTVFTHSAEARTNLRLAFDAPLRRYDPFPAEWFGHTIAFGGPAGEWRIDPDRPAVPADVLRVVWHSIAAGAPVATQENGYIDLILEPDAQMHRVRVRVIRTSGADETLADYFMRFSSTTTAAGETGVFEANGSVSRASTTVQFTLRSEDFEAVGSDARQESYDVTLSEGGFTYTVNLDADQTATGIESASVIANATVGGVVTRLELDAQQAPGQERSGSGTIRHGGAHIANLTITDGDMTFLRPDGGAFTSAQRERLGTLVYILFIPLEYLEAYFS
jgi:hypothetical protein